MMYSCRNIYEALAETSTSDPNKWSYAVALKLDALLWDDAKKRVCQEFGLPNNEEYSVSLVSRDFAKIGLINFGERVDWPDVVDFLALSTIFKAKPILVTSPNTHIAPKVAKAIPDIIFVDTSGNITDRKYYVDEITKIITAADTNELPQMLRNIIGESIETEKS